MPPCSPGWAFFLDIDGTLLDIAETPDAAEATRREKTLVRRLHEAAGGALALVSGRSLAAIDELFAPLKLAAAGQHGAERRNALGLVTSHAPELDLGPARQRLAQAIFDKPGLLLEDKGLSLALHYRRAPDLAGFVHQTMEALLADLDAEYTLQQGKSVLELKPAGKDKGIAVLEFMAEAPFAGRIPAFVGDDATDEYGFATVNELQGYSIKVGAGDTRARWRLDNVKAVQQWLRSISD